MLQRLESSYLGRVFVVKDFIVGAAVVFGVLTITTVLSLGPEFHYEQYLGTPHSALLVFTITVFLSIGIEVLLIFLFDVYEVLFPVQYRYYRKRFPLHLIGPEGNSTVPRDVFQQRVLMLFISKLKQSPTSKYRLAVDYVPSGEFDEVYFNYQEANDEWRHVSMQLFHEYHNAGDIDNNNNNKIDQADLLEDGVLNILELYESWKQIPRKRGKMMFLIYTHKKFTLQDHVMHDHPNHFPYFNSLFINSSLKSIHNAHTEAYLKSKFPRKEEKKIDNFFNEVLMADRQPNLHECDRLIRGSFVSQKNLYLGVFKTWTLDWMNCHRGEFIKNCNLHVVYRQMDYRVNAILSGRC